MNRPSKLTFHQRRGPRPLVFAGIGLVLALGIGLWLYSPRVLAVQPSGSPEASSFSPVTIVFSTAMNRASVEGRLHMDPQVPGAVGWEGQTLRFVPAQPWPAGRTVEITLQSGAQALNGLPLLIPLRWSFTSASLRVVFLVHSAEGSELLLLPLQAGSAKTLLQTALLVDEFAVSPTGGFVVYSAGPANGGSDLYLLDLNGSPPQRILDCHGEACRYPAISQDGTRIAYQQAELGLSAGGITTPKNARVWILNVATRQTAAISESDHDAHTPAWAPQGWIAYYDQTSGMTIVDDLHGKRIRISNSSGSVGAWSPDGTILIFPEIQLALPSATPPVLPTPPEGASPSSVFYSHLMRVAVATLQTEDLSKSPVVEDTSPAMSPDGQQVAFARKYLDPLHWTPGRQLWVMGADGSDPKQLTNAPDYNISSILWSPDGSWLLFVRFDETNPSQPPEIWTIQADGHNAKRLSVGGLLPQWLP